MIARAKKGSQFAINKYLQLPMVVDIPFSSKMDKHRTV